MQKIRRYILMTLMALALCLGTLGTAIWMTPVTAEAAVSLKTPVLTDLSVGKGKITVEWKKVSGAQSYWIYRKTGDGKYSKVAAQKAAEGLSFVDKDLKPGRLYTYTVRAIAKDNGTTVKSDYNAAGISGRAQIPAPELTAISIKNSKVNLRWSTLDDVSGYAVYRKEEGGKYIMQKELYGDAVSSYKDSKTEVGHIYTYTVRAFYEDDQAIIYGKYDNDGLSVQVPLGIPSIKEVETAGGHVMIHWKKVEGANGYIVYRKEGSGNYKQLKSSANTTLDYVWDLTAVPGKTYRYAVRAYVTVDGSKIKGDPAYASSSIVCRPEAPMITSLKVGTKKDTLSWTEIKAADGYEVYKKNKGTNGKWEKITDVPAGETTVKVPHYTKGTTTYTVKAVVEAGKKIVNSINNDTLTNEKPAYKELNVLFDGDSITWGYTWNKEQAEVTYPERVSQILGCSYDNEGVSDSTVTRKSSTEVKSLVARAEAGKTSYAGYDIICIAAGTNDYNYDMTIGNVSDTEDTTFCGAWNTMFRLIEEQNPEAKVVLITPCYRGRVKSNWSRVGMDCKNNAGNTLQDYVDAMMRLAEIHGAYVYDSVDRGIISQDNYRTTTYDALHPTRETYGEMGADLADWLEKKVLD